MTGPRKPTTTELDELGGAVTAIIASDDSEEEYARIKGLVEDAGIAVFDDYTTDSPGYSGKLMTVIWSASPRMYEVFIWRQGKITRVAQDKLLQNEIGELEAKPELNR